MYKVDISNAFNSRQSLLPESQVLERIKKSYAKAKQDQLKASDDYQVSREWLPIYEGYMGSTIDVLLNGDIDSMHQLYSNFFRHPCSTGLHGMHFEMVEKYMTATPSTEDLQKYINEISIRARLFLLNCTNTHPSVLSRPSVGNPYGYHMIDPDGNRNFIYGGAEHHYYYAERIKMLLRENKGSKVLELGGGFGGMASFLLRDFNLSMYCGIDLPENLALQSYFLMTLFPNKKFGLYGEFDINNMNNLDDNYDVLLLPNFCIENIPDDYFSLFYNSYSLAEMSLDVANNYLKHASNICQSYIYHVNHVHWPVSSDSFIINPKKFELFLRFPTMWGRNPVNPTIDHHDFIYSRKC